MKRLTLLLVGLAAVAGCFRAGAQIPAEPFGVYKADIGTLLRFIRSEITPAVYCVRDTSDHKSYTVRASREQFLQKAFDELRANGYTVTEHDGKYFIVRGASLATTLPSGYFDERKPAVDSSFLQYLAEQKAVMTFQNKIYEIGDPEVRQRSGRATVRGYVRDVASGEPLVGVSVYDESGKSFTTTDEFGDFWFRQVEGKKYHLWFEADGYVAREIADVDATETDANIGRVGLYKMIPLG